MTLSHPVKVTQHVSCIPSYSSWSHWSTAKQQSRSRCLTCLKTRLLRHTLQLRHLGSGPLVTSTPSWQEAWGGGEWSHLGSRPDFSACGSSNHWTSCLTSVLENPPLPSVGQAWTLHLPHTCTGTLLSPRNTSKLEHGMQTTTTLAQTNAIISASQRRKSSVLMWMACLYPSRKVPLKTLRKNYVFYICVLFTENFCDNNGINRQPGRAAQWQLAEIVLHC